LLEHEREPAVLGPELSFEVTTLGDELAQDSDPPTMCACAVVFVGQVVEMAGESPAGVSAKGEGLGPEVVELVERREAACGRGVV